MGIVVFEDKNGTNGTVWDLWDRMRTIGPSLSHGSYLSHKSHEQQALQVVEPRPSYSPEKQKSPQSKTKPTPYPAVVNGPLP